MCRENDLLQTQDAQHQQELEREKHYNALVKSHKDRIVQLEEAMKSGGSVPPPSAVIAPVVNTHAYRKTAPLEADSFSEISESDTSTSPGGCKFCHCCVCSCCFSVYKLLTGAICR